MKKYRVQVTTNALEDMEGIYEYIATVLFMPDTAMEQYNRIAEAIESLETSPERIKPVTFEPEKTRGLRRMSVDHYAVFFFIHEDCVIITNVLYGASDIESRLR